MGPKTRFIPELCVWVPESALDEGKAAVRSSREYKDRWRAIFWVNRRDSPPLEIITSGRFLSKQSLPKP
jgi:hypothetical protein